MVQRKIYISPYFFSLTTVIFLINACNPVKYVPEDKYLLKKNTFIYNKKVLTSEEILPFIKQKPNRKILIFRMHLGLYNLSGKKDKGINRWLRKIGEEPMVVDNFLTERTAEQLRMYLSNKGYRDAVVRDTLKIKRGRKAKVVYVLSENKPFVIQNIHYQIEDSLLRTLIFSDTSSSLIYRGALFSTILLENERQRIERVCRVNGYYNFLKEYIHFKADTFHVSRTVNLALIIRGFRKNTTEASFSYDPHKQYFIKNIYVYTDYVPQRMLANDTAYIKTMDTITYENIYIIHTGKLPLRPHTLLQAIFIKKDSLYNITDEELTYQHLSALRQFRFINLRFVEVEDSLQEEYGMLNCFIQLNSLWKQSYAFDIEGTNASGDLGVGGSASYQNKNLFRGAEILDFSVRGAIEALKGREDKRIKNTVELGSELHVTFPKFLLPIRSTQFIKKYNPRTRVSVAYNYQKRPDYTRSIANASFGYHWRSTKYFTHSVSPVELNIIKLPPSPELDHFMSQIRNTYLENSFHDHFVPATNYRLMFSNQVISENKNFIYIYWNAESAGSILTGINSLMNNKRVDGSYTIFGIPYSQYVKTDIDIRYYQRLNKSDQLVYRMFLGVGMPYDNSVSMPFEKKYFAGGANSIRAWQVRTLGPGTHTDKTTRYPNSLGDVKIEGNIEYRFDLFWKLKGALFVDAGNIWAINRYDKRPGAMFDIDDFFYDIAIGSGFGTRFDFSFFVFRVDVGCKFHDPSKIVGQKWIFGTRRLTSDDYNFVLGIGYPF